MAYVQQLLRGKKFFMTDGSLHQISKATEGSSDIQLLWVMQRLDSTMLVLPSLRQNHVTSQLRCVYVGHRRGNQVPSSRVSAEAAWRGTTVEEAARSESKEQQTALSFAPV